MTERVDREKALRKMTQLMMQGAAMLSEVCPLDGLPLFRLRSGETVCPIHGRVLIVSTDEEARDAEIESILSEIKYRATKSALESMERGESPETIRAWLEVVEVAERILRMGRAMQAPVKSEAQSPEDKRGRR